MNTQTTSRKLQHPRDYAAAILAEPLRERRAQLLEACPAHWRDQVREHVESAFAKTQAYRAHLLGRIAGAKSKPPAAPRRDQTPSVTDHKKSAPEVGNHHLATLRGLVKGAA